MAKALLPEFSEARDTLDWAKEAFDEADTIVKDYFVQTAQTRHVELEPDGLHKLIIYRLGARLPRALRRKATESLNNIKHSFDQSLFAACSAVSSSVRKINYPWSQRPSDLERLLVGRKIPEMLHAVIRSHEPYPVGGQHSGGNDTIRNLATIANRKHDVGLSVGAEVGTISFPTVSVMSATGETAKFGGFDWDQAKNQIQVAKIPIGMEMDDPKISYQVVFDKVGALNGHCIFGCLELFLQHAEIAFETLQSKCVDSRI